MKINVLPCISINSFPTLETSPSLVLSVKSSELSLCDILGSDDWSVSCDEYLLLTLTADSDVEIRGDEGSCNTTTELWKGEEGSGTGVGEYLAAELIFGS